MSSEMIQVSLGDFIDFRNGKSSPDRTLDGEFDVFGSNGIIGKCAENNTSAFSLIIGRVGSYCGSIYHSRKACWVTDNAIIGSLKNKDELNFWYFLLTSLDINAMSSGSGQPLINQKTLNCIQVRIPLSSITRVEIGNFLGLFNEKIKMNNETNQTLEQMAQALFKSWFVDFEPVKAKIAVLEAGGSQEEATLAAMTAISGKNADSLAVFEREQPEKYVELKTTAELFPVGMQDSELGEIPIGWFCTDLSNLALLNTSSWSKKNHPESLKYVDLANTKWGVIHSTEEFLFPDAPSRARRILKTGDTIVGTVRPGNGSYAFISEDGLTGSTGFAVLTPKHKYFGSFIYICATSKDNIERLAHLADGGAYPAVNADVVLSTPCIIPVGHNSSKDLIACFHHYVRELFAYKHSNLRQNKSLEQLRNTLLPKLLSGEITLPEAEASVKDAEHV
ncbi:restriction endonuclease subunit S [Serratia rhizosphaerae]|uniref:restriction endonuclease subunit S n=1 Tax=Serratia rhizosphaerae TaxID=2597702 RepID=UPI002DBD4492|nr:restriction endonuclease subunit S [Serratia rhizosphaerae]MEB6334614.1 restriction endonuclease subunit S [Serratia rhizosphaerae]